MESRRAASAVGMLLEAATADDYQPLLDRAGPSLVPVLIKALGDNPNWQESHPDLWEQAATGDNPVIGGIVSEQAGSELFGEANPQPSTADEPADADATRVLIDKLYQLAKDRENPRWRITSSAEKAIANQRGRLDWDTVLTAHRARPFWPEFVESLLERKDCPERTVLELAGAHPRGLDLMVKAERQLTAAELRGLLHTLASTETLTTLLPQRLGRDLSATDLLTVVRPARTVLMLARERIAVSPEGAEERAAWTAFRAMLTDLVAERLTDSVTAWRALRARLPKFNGTVSELIDDAAHAASGTAARSRAGSEVSAWPDAADVPVFSETPSLHVNRAAFVMLMNSATTDVQWTLLPHFDGRTRYDLLAQGEWRDEWLPRAIADGDHEVLVLLSRNLRLDVEAIEALAGLDDPAVNAALIYQRRATDDQRHKLVSGTPFAPGQTGPLPIHDTLRTFILSEWAEYWLTPMLLSRDPELVTHSLARLPLAQNVVLRVLQRRWERYGRNGLLEVLPDTIQKGVRTLVTELVDDPDADAALSRLREAAHEAESPKRIARRLRAGSAPRQLIKEGFRWEWDVLITEHRDNPFDSGALRALQKMDDCPEVLRQAVPATLDSAEKRAVKALVSGRPPATVLGRTTVNTWSLHAIRMGLLSPVDVLRHGQPAHKVLNPELADQAFRDELATLVGKHLTGRPEAWLLALVLLADFAGTVPELLESAALTVG